MNPSFLSVCAKDNLSPDAGISAKSCRAGRAPRRGELTEADTAGAEGPQVGARAPAAVAPVAVPPLELWLLIERFFVQRLACHWLSSTALRRASPTAPAAVCPPHPFWR